MEINAIYKQADKLFTLIEEAVNATSDDKAAEVISEKMGSMLKSRKGHDILDYASALSKNTAETTTHDLERGFMFLKGSELNKILKLSKWAMKLVDNLEAPETNKRSLGFQIREIREYAPEIQDLAAGEFVVRAIDYEMEVENQKG